MTPTALNEQSSESSGSNSMTRKQFLSLMKCEQCFLDLKEEFLYSNPGKENLFDDIKKISENEFNEMVGYASVVLKGSEHPVTIFPNEFDQVQDYMHIVGLKGCYMAFNDDVEIFFDTLKLAMKWVDDDFKDFKNNFLNS
jgi:hypothetical protein